MSKKQYHRQIATYLIPPMRVSLFHLSFSNSFFAAPKTTFPKHSTCSHSYEIFFPSPIYHPVCVLFTLFHIIFYTSFSSSIYTPTPTYQSYAHGHIHAQWRRNSVNIIPISRVIIPYFYEAVNENYVTASLFRPRPFSRPI